MSFSFFNFLLLAIFLYFCCIIFNFTFQGGGTTDGLGWCVGGPRNFASGRVDLGTSRVGEWTWDLRGRTSGPGILASGRVDSGPSRVDEWTWDLREWTCGFGTFASGRVDLGSARDLGKWYFYYYYYLGRIGS